MECKGAYSQRDKDPNDELPSYLYRDGDAIKLKVKHRYFAQVQGQMAITKRQWCDFFVTTAHGHILIRIDFDPRYWENLESQLCSFYVDYFVPLLLKCQAQPQIEQDCIPTTSEKVDMEVDDNDSVVCPFCSEECEDEVDDWYMNCICCDLCDKWVHFKCAGIKTDRKMKVAQSDIWVCSICTCRS